MTFGEWYNRVDAIVRPHLGDKTKAAIDNHACYIEYQGGTTPKRMADCVLIPYLGEAFGETSGETSGETCVKCE